ncbi:MAG: NUDIX hydrolase [Acidaminococcaceae bacterium]|nr:NUDIX hydrolase [Acidaminococcaceae bacterium]
MQIKKFHEPALDEVQATTQDVFQGNLLKVKKDIVTLPDGRTADREYIRHPGAVAVVPILEDGRVVLVKQCRYPLGTVMWEIPAGKLDKGPGEDLLECAKRELSEETGYEAKEWEYLFPIATTPGFSDEIIHLFAAKGLTAHNQHPDEDEFIACKIFTMDEIKSMIMGGEFFDAKSICALLYLGGKNESHTERRKC